MKLSLKPGHGATVVAGGRLLVVRKPHPVPTVTRSVHADDPSTDRYRKPGAPPPVYPKGPTVDAVPGDLAIEMVYPKTGRVMGYSYLAGPAIQLNLYVDEPTPDLFEAEPAEIREFVLPPIGAAFEDVIKTANAARLGAPAVYVFRLLLGESELKSSTAAEVADAIVQAWSLVPKDMTDAEVDERDRSHLLGFVEVGKRNAASIHLQPKHHASDFNATPFQIELLLDALRTGRCRRTPGDA